MPMPPWVVTAAYKQTARAINASLQFQYPLLAPIFHHHPLGSHLPSGDFSQTVTSLQEKEFKQQTHSLPFRTLHLSIIDPRSRRLAFRNLALHYVAEFNNHYSYLPGSREELTDLIEEWSKDMTPQALSEDISHYHGVLAKRKISHKPYDTGESPDEGVVDDSPIEVLTNDLADSLMPVSEREALLYEFMSSPNFMDAYHSYRRVLQPAQPSTGEFYRTSLPFDASLFWNMFRYALKPVFGDIINPDSESPALPLMQGVAGAGLLFDPATHLPKRSSDSKGMSLAELFDISEDKVLEFETTLRLPHTEDMYARGMIPNSDDRSRLASPSYQQLCKRYGRFAGTLHYTLRAVGLGHEKLK